MKKLFLYLFYSALTFLFAISIWEFIVTAGFINANLFPAPSSVFSAFVEMYNSGELLNNSIVSLYRVLIGFILGGSVGIFLGILTGKIQSINFSFGQLMHFLRNIPPIALVPLAIVWFGIGEESKVFLIMWSVVFPVWINTHAGIVEVQKEYLWLAKIFELNKFQTLKEIIIPAASTFIITGLRIGIGLAFIALIAAELAASNSGIGFLISNSHLLFRIDKMLAGILLLGVFGLLADKLFVFFANKTIAWSLYDRRQN